MSGFPRPSAPGGPAGGGLSGTYPNPSVNFDDQFTFTTSAISKVLASWEACTFSAAATGTLPPTPAVGDQVVVSATTGSGVLVVAANEGQTINGNASISTTLGASFAGQSVTLIYVSQGVWRAHSAVTSDWSLNLRINGLLSVLGTATIGQSTSLNGGLATAAHAAFTAPVITSGVAFTPNATFDTVVQIDLAATTLGSLTVTYGPSTGAESTWLPTANVVAGSDIVSTLYVPAGWKVVATATGVTVALSASVHRI